MTENPRENQKTALVRGLIFAFLYLLLTLYFYSFSKYGFNIWDEGGYANGTLRTYNGESALTDFNPSGYLPGRYLYSALFFKWFGISIQSLRLSVVLITPGMILLVYAIARKFMPFGFSALAALCMLSAPAMYYNRFYPFFCVLNLYCLVELMQKKRLLNLFLLGGSIALSCLFKFEVGLFSLIISGFILPLMNLNIARLREIASKPGFRIFIFLAMVIISASLVYLTRHDFYELAVAMIFTTHDVWGNPFPDIFPFPHLLNSLGRHEMFERVLFYVPVWIYAGVGVLLVARIYGRRWENRDFYLAAVLLFGVCAFGLVLWRAGFDNLLRTLPPSYILFCYLLHLLREKLLATLKKEVPPSSFLWLKTEAVEILVLLFPLMFIYEMNVHHGFYAGTVGAIKFERTRLQMDRIDVYTNADEAKWVKTVVTRIQTHTQKDDPILALPLNPIFYFLSGRVNPTPYDWILPGMLDERKEKQLVEQLRANMPKMIVYIDIAIDNKEERRFSNYAPRLSKFIIERYRLMELVGFFQLLVLKEESDGSLENQQHAPEAGNSVPPQANAP